MGEYLADIETLFNKLAAMRMPLVEPMHVAILVVSISSVDSFQGTVAAIKTMEDHKATWDYVSGRLIEEQRTQKMSDSTEINDARVQAAAARTAARILANTKCFKCNKKGHIARNCRSKGGEGSGNRKSNGTPNVRAAVARSAGSCTSFIVDSEASQHIANDVAVFTSIEEIPAVSVHLADNTVVEAVKQGTVRIELETLKPGSGSNVILELGNVLIIPEAGISMLSCAQLDKKGISSMISEGICTFLDSGREESSNRICFEAYGRWAVRRQWNCCSRARKGCVCNANHAEN